MKTQNNSSPNYKKIFTDIIQMKFPEKEEECRSLLAKDNLSVFDIILLNDKIFGQSSGKHDKTNQKHKSYSKKDILKILDYQKKNNLNNMQTAAYFKLSRNTIGKWKKIFLV